MKQIEDQNSSCLCGLSLSMFTLLVIKTEKLKNNHCWEQIVLMFVYPPLSFGNKTSNIIDFPYMSLLECTASLLPGSNNYLGFSIYHFCIFLYSFSKFEYIPGDIKF